MDDSSIVLKTNVGRDKKSKLYCQQNQENGLVVIFPDENYGHDRPLLYYARKAALIEGHDVLCIAYKRKLTWRDMGLYTIDLETDTSLDIIRKCLEKTYKHIHFISKGIGTEVAGAASNRLGYEKIKNLYLTPTHSAAKYIVNSKCTMIVGNNDGIFKEEYIRQIQEHKNIELFTIEKANRNLEVPRNMDKTLEVLGQVTSIYSNFFKELSQETTNPKDLVL